MKAFGIMDGWLIRRVDTLTGHLANRGIGLPILKRELVLAEMAVLTMLPISAFAGGYPIVAGFWAIIMSFMLPRRYRSWKAYDGDAKAEWTEGLARRYFATAERNRQSPWFRLLAWIFLSSAGAVCAAGVLADVYSMADLFLVGLFFIDVLQKYADCAIPQNPPSRRVGRRAFSPA